ncbi:hypothetical protein LCGC14_1031450 [marine sediment metagenome]|uniref:Uncharacterized protein n=1 Tax=marine sediment metagenome TaxID=412755 RepID=A0A0F9MUG7_9ZZZZ
MAEKIGGYCSIRGCSQLAGHSGHCDTDDLEHYMTACSRLKSENARLQDGYDSLKCQYDEEHDKLLALVAREGELVAALEEAKSSVWEALSHIEFSETKDLPRLHALLTKADKVFTAALAQGKKGRCNNKEEDEIEAQPKADSDDALRMRVASLERKLQEGEGKR